MNLPFTLLESYWLFQQLMKGIQLICQPIWLSDVFPPHQMKPAVGIPSTFLLYVFGCYHKSRIYLWSHFISSSGERQQQGSHWIFVVPSQVHQVWRQPTSPLQPQHHHAPVHQGKESINISIFGSDDDDLMRNDQLWRSDLSRVMSLCLAGGWEWRPETNSDPTSSEGEIQRSEWAGHGYEAQ